MDSPEIVPGVEGVVLIVKAAALDVAVEQVPVITHLY
jgi:hypothetical protein